MVQREKTIVSTANRAAVYARLSKDRDGSVSIDKQIENCSGRVPEHDVDFDPALDPEGDVYVDDVSAYSGVRRRSLDRLLDEIRAGRYSIVIVYEISRLSRRTDEMLAIVKMLDELGVRLIIIKESVDTFAPGTGKMMLTILAAVAENESATISFRVGTTQDKLATLGRWRGGTVPVGYEIVRNRDGDGYQLQPSEQAAAMLRKSAAMLLDGKTLSQAAATLDAEGYRNRNERKTSLRAANLGKWLRSPATKGVAMWRGEPVLDADGNPVTWFTEPVLTPETWDEVMDILGRNTRSGSTTRNPDILLASLVKCAGCGSTMTGLRPSKPDESKPHNGHYSCRNREGATSCQEPASISMEALDQFVSLLIVAWAANLEATQVGPRELEIRRRVAELDAAITRHTNDLMSGLLDGAERTRRQLVERNELCLTEKDQLQSELESLRARQRRATRSASAVKDWRALPVEQKRLALRQIVDRVEVTKLDRPRGPKAAPETRTAVYVYTSGGETECLYSPSEVDSDAASA